MSVQHAEPLAAVYELRQAAGEHGKALAEADVDATPQALDRLMSTMMDLETKTSAALDECATSSEEAVHEALEKTA